MPTAARATVRSPQRVTRRSLHRTVPAVDKAARALVAMAAAGQPRGISEMARELGLSKGTLREILLTLQRYGLVQRDADAQFTLGSGLRVLADSATPDLELVAAPYLQRIVEEFGETCILGVAEHPHLRLAAAVEADEQIRTSVNVGGHIAIKPNGIGAVLLTRKPIAFDDGQCQKGLRAAAAGIDGPDNSRVACIFIVGPRERLDVRRLSRIAERLVTYAKAMSQRLSAASDRRTFKPGARVARSRRRRASHGAAAIGP